MQYSPLGAISDVFWHEIKNHAKNVDLDVYQIMPNHIHGIIILKNGNENSGNNANDNDHGNAETRHTLSLPPSFTDHPQNVPKISIGHHRFQNQGKNTISSIIGSYKSAVTKHAQRLGFNHGWQPRFYDHIIRNQESYNRIRNYIINNPANWNQDKFNWKPNSK